MMAITLYKLSLQRDFPNFPQTFHADLGGSMHLKTKARLSLSEVVATTPIMGEETAFHNEFLWFLES